MRYLVESPNLWIQLENHVLQCIRTKVWFGSKFQIRLVQQHRRNFDIFFGRIQEHEHVPYFVWAVFNVLSTPTLIKWPPFLARVVKINLIIRFTFRNGAQKCLQLSLNTNVKYSFPSSVVHLHNHQILFRIMANTIWQVVKRLNKMIEWPKFFTIDLFWLYLNELNKPLIYRSSFLATKFSNFFFLLIRPTTTKNYTFS